MIPIVRSLSRSVLAIDPAVRRLAEEDLDFSEAIRRGYFSPTEEEQLIGWFSRVLTARGAAWEVIDDAVATVGTSFDRVLRHEEWCCFLVGYVAACQVVRLDRLVVEEVATHRLVQRKLNEGSESLRIPRKQLTAIFRSLSRPRTALKMLRAMRHVENHRETVEALADDPDVGTLARDLARFEEVLDPSRSRFFGLFQAFETHALRRRGASALQQSLLSALEASGRVVSELRLPPGRRVLGHLEQIRPQLEPGDVLVTRHEGALTNLFLPGFWPHVALYVGDAEQRRGLGIGLGGGDRPGPEDDESVLEALKDGVLFRRLESTLAVDAVVVLRPRLSSDEIGEGLERAARHEGKLYNFDFDFFRSDRLVCTEVVYRGFDGVGPMTFALVERSGRPTLSAEDLLDLAFDTDLFDVVGVVGVEGCEDDFVTGAGALGLVERSYR